MGVKSGLFILALCVPLAVQAGFREFTVHFKTESKGKVGYTVPEEMIYYMDNDRLRQDIVTKEGRAVFILELDGDQLITTILDPEKKTYMRMNGKADDEGRILFELPRGEESPCKNDPDSTCERLGTGHFKGFRIIKWRVVEDGGEPTVYWYAPKLGFFLKSESDEMTLTATRIEDRAPPAGTFEPPAGFRRITYEEFLSGQAGGMPSFPADPPGGPEYRVPAAVDEPDDIGETAAADDDAEPNPLDEAVTEGLKDAFKSLFGK